MTLDEVEFYAYAGKFGTDDCWVGSSPQYPHLASYAVKASGALEGIKDLVRREIERAARDS